MDTNEIGEQLQRRRKSLGLSQAKLAELAKVATHTVVNIESGQGNPRLQTLIKVAETLGFDLELRI